MLVSGLSINGGSNGSQRAEQLRRRQAADLREP
jgi:hypothetical protein